jgi:hypothetical protein
MHNRLARVRKATNFIEQLIDAPHLPEAVRALDPARFASVVERVGIEDAGPLLHLATRAQLLEAFDADAFHAPEPGAREAFDRERFVLWLDVLADEGLAFAADRLAHLPEDLLVEALSSVVRVLDEDALLLRARERETLAEGEPGPDDAALRASLDGYTIEARVEDAWDTALAVLCELDRGRPELLERVLARCARVSERVPGSADTFARELSPEGQLLEDIEDARVARRARAGFVEPRDAKAFLALARSDTPDGLEAHDPITRSYLGATTAKRATRARHEPFPAPRLLDRLTLAEPSVSTTLARGGDGHTPIVDAMRTLRHLDPHAFSERVDELAYLVNVLIAAGRGEGGERMSTAEATEATLATVEFGAHLAVRDAASQTHPIHREATVAELTDALRWSHADAEFRRASHAIATRRWPGSARGYLRGRRELDDAIAASLRPAR